MVPIYMNEMFYGFAPLVGGLFILDLHCRNDVFNIETKRIKLSHENTTMLWHCRLGHVGKKCMEKLHKDGVLKYFDIDSFDTCEACLMGKMIKTPFNGVVKRATELLEIIHTNVCGPMSTTAHNGYLYFVTLLMT